MSTSRREASRPNTARINSALPPLVTDLPQFEAAEMVPALANTSFLEWEVVFVPLICVFSALFGLDSVVTGDPARHTIYDHIYVTYPIFLGHIQGWGGIFPQTPPPEHGINAVWLLGIIIPGPYRDPISQSIRSLSSSFHTIINSVWQPRSVRSGSHGGFLEEGALNDAEEQEGLEM